MINEYLASQMESHLLPDEKLIWVGETEKEYLKQIALFQYEGTNEIIKRQNAFDKEFNRGLTILGIIFFLAGGFVIVRGFINFFVPVIIFGVVFTIFSLGIIFSMMSGRNIRKDNSESLETIMARKRYLYAVTSERILIKYLYSGNVFSMSIEKIPTISFTEYKNLSGTIFFGNRETISDGSSTHYSDPPKFEGIEDVKNVYQKIIQQQKRIR